MIKTSQWVRDEQSQRRDAWRKAYEKHKQEKIKWAKEQEEDCVWVENDYISPANEERQLGRIMSTKDWEDRVRKLVPSAHFEHNPFNPSMKALYILKNGKKDYVCAYHAGFMPEHSIVKVKEEVVWDPAQTDKPLGRVSESSYTKTDREVRFDPNVLRPGWKKIKKPAGELKRGWRTPLIKLVLSGFLTPSQVEKEFGEPSSLYGKKAWAYYSGRKTDYQMAF